MAEIVVVLTCHNRCEKTVNCIKKLHDGNNSNVCHYVVVDDASTDGTCGAIEALGYADVDIVEGDGNLFWNGGMHKGIQEAVLRHGLSNYILLVNDDVDFEAGVIDRMVEAAASIEKKIGSKAVLVGATKDESGSLSYGGIVYGKGLNYEMAGPDRPETECSTFNANCTLIPMEVMSRVGNIDSYYKHSMGDFDLGLRISRSGTRIFVYDRYVGTCNDNPKTGTWMDPSLGVIRRIKLKETRKGLPFKDWFHYLNRNFGLPTACVRSITPYIKILLHR